MNYSLSSSRKIGDYTQKIITTCNDAPKATSSAFLTSLKAWHTAFAGLDPQERIVGTIAYKGFTEAPSDSATNLATKADIIVTVLSKYAGNPKTTTIKLTDVTQQTITTVINTAYSALVGANVSTVDNYLISAILNLH